MRGSFPVKNARSPKWSDNPIRLVDALGLRGITRSAALNILDELQMRHQAEFCDRTGQVKVKGRIWGIYYDLQAKPFSMALRHDPTGEYRELHQGKVAGMLWC